MTEDMSFINDVVDHIKSIEGIDYGAYNPELYTEEDKKDEVSLREAVRRNTLFYKNIKNPNSKANQQIYTLASVNKPLTRMVALDGHLRGNTNALNTLQSFLGVDVDYDIGDKTITAAAEYVKRDPTLQDFFDYQRVTYRDNPDDAFKDTYGDANQRELLAISRNVKPKNRKLFDLHSQVLRSQHGFKPLIEEGMTTTVRISGVQNKEDGLHYNVPTYDPYNQRVIDPKTPKGYNQLDTLIKTFGGWDQFPSFEDPNVGDTEAKTLHKYIEADSMLYGNTDRKQGGFIDMQEGGEIGIPPGADLDPTIPDAENPIDALPDDVPEGTGTTGANITFSEPTTPILTGEDAFVTSEDTGVVQDELPSDIDTSQGFYSVNPAPGESAADFAARNPLPTLEEQFPDPEPADPTTYKPDEGYVSPRISTPYSSVGDTGTGDDGTATLADQLASAAGTGPSSGDIAYTDPALVSGVETISNYLTGVEAAELVTESLKTTWSGPNFWGGVSEVPENWSLEGWTSIQNTLIDWTKSNVNLGKKLKIINADGVEQKLGIDRNLMGFGDEATWIRETDLVWDAAAGMTREEAISFEEYVENIEAIQANKTFSFTTKAGGETLDQISARTGISKEVIVARNDKLFADKYKVNSQNAAKLGNVKLDPNENLTLPQRLKRSPFKQKLDSMGEWFTQVKNTELGNLPGETRITLGNTADDMFAALAAGFLTPDGKFDAEKFAIAGAGSFAKTNVVDAYASKAVLETMAGAGATAVNDIATQFGIDIANLNADQALSAVMRHGSFKNLPTSQKQAMTDAATASKHMKAIGGSIASAITTLGLGGDLEDAVKAGALTAGGVYGAEYLTQTAGLPPGPAGAIIGAALAVLQGGGVEEAGKGAAYGYLLSNPATAPFAYALMAVEFILGMKKPSNKTAYYSFDFDDFEGLSYSQGDYDPEKANPENVEFMKKIGEPLIPIVKGLEETSGMNLIGDLQFHYGGRDGLYYTIGSRDISGTPEEMFLNRLDYFDGRDQSTADGGNVYRSRRFGADQAGIAEMYEELLGELSYIVKNKITDMSGYTGKKLSLEETKALLAESNITGVSGNLGIRQGGKISLDKGGDVQYNKSNYGFVNKKDKAPPSARADDVPMNLKEGDYVLSQPAVALYGEDTINRMVQRASTQAGKNLKSGGKVPVNVHNGEYIIPKNLTEYIGSNVLETMNNRGLMSVGERPNT